MAALNDWNTVDANNDAAPPDGWPENTMQYSDVNNTGRAVQGTLKRYFADVNGSLVAGGVADAYTLSLNESGYTSYFDGMYFACKINASNTGSVTIDVNGIGAVDVFRRDGNELEVGDIVAGGIYEMRYDSGYGAFQLSGTISASASVFVDQLTLTNTKDPDLVDSEVALRVGTDSPDSENHIEMGPTTIQGKSDATGFNDLVINPWGGSLELGNTENISDTNSIVSCYFNTYLLASFSPVELALGDGFTTSPPTSTTGLEVGVGLYDRDVTDQNGFMGFDGQSGKPLRIKNLAEGATIQMQVADTAFPFAGTWLEIDPTAGVDLYHLDTGVPLIMAQTVAAASGGLLVRNTVTGSGLERVLTTSDVTSSAAGNNTNIQYNTGGSLDASDEFTWNSVTQTIRINPSVTGDDAALEMGRTGNSGGYVQVTAERNTAREGAFLVGMYHTDGEGTTRHQVTGDGGASISAATAGQDGIVTIEAYTTGTAGVSGSSPAEIILDSGNNQIRFQGNGVNNTEVKVRDAELQAEQVRRDAFTTTATMSGGGSVGLSSSNDSMGWARVGNLVTVQGSISVNSVSSPVGDLELELPFTALNLTESADFGYVAVYGSGLSGGTPNKWLRGFFSGGSDLLTIEDTDGGSLASLLNSSCNFAFTFSYVANSDSTV